jgi:hypothetical protein
MTGQVTIIPESKFMDSAQQPLPGKIFFDRQNESLPVPMSLRLNPCPLPITANYTQIIHGARPVYFASDLY